MHKLSKAIPPRRLQPRQETPLQSLRLHHHCSRSRPAARACRGKFDSPSPTRATLALYMGLHALPHLHRGLTTAGMPETTPAALIERGGTDRQRLLTGTLASITAQAPTWSDGGPALILVGEAVRHGTNWTA